VLTKHQLSQLRRDHRGRNRLTRAIELADTTQVKLADATGIKQSQISKIARGQYGSSGLPTETARRLSDFFGCSIEDLFPARSVAA
jgi:transcriptional regulator with XRE-family HTH domain